MVQYRVKAEVIETRGRGCDKGLKVGDVFELSEDRNAFCSWAYAAMFPFVQAFQYGADFPWEKDPNVTYVGCPDPYNTVVFRLTREKCEEG
ncbi:MAG: TIGR04076 family protein [Firmicutes bacterium]|nr:TIGR04076 family protein [Bacillota bacterium]